MPRWLKFFLIGLSLWLLSGLYVVRGNERAAVRRFGRVLTDGEGRVILQRSGPHFDWPWPLSRVDRVNLNEIRTVNLQFEETDAALQRTLLGDGKARPSAFLTGDKNLLHVRMAVQYRLDEHHVRDFLYRSASVEQRLECLAEAVTADVLAQSGVDFVQISGLAKLREQLTARLNQRLARERLGVLIEEVAINSISPPVSVKADFLDVANARADREQIIQSALSAAEQRRQTAQADAREIQDQAQSKARETVQAALGSAARFELLIRPFHLADSSQDPARRLTLERYYQATIAQIYERVKHKVFLDTGQPVDLTIWRFTGGQGSRDKAQGPDNNLRGNQDR